jgi:hypothetical protein
MTIKDSFETRMVLFEYYKQVLVISLVHTERKLLD